MTIVEKYIQLVERFLNNDLSTKEFEKAYLDAFHADANSIGDELYDVIEPLFLDVQDYTDIPELLNSGSPHYITEIRLRENAAKTLQELRDLK